MKKNVKKGQENKAINQNGPGCAVLENGCRQSLRRMGLGKAQCTLLLVRGYKEENRDDGDGIQCKAHVHRPISSLAVEKNSTHAEL